ncbi:MAG: hypothetical protein KKD86_09715 [Bacteroidetes bacterium]|nr:hypothetical protein [Bacteroidota bacterium]MBU1679116.1 hypothetical protein [Bacteroidota bacterium]
MKLKIIYFVFLISFYLSPILFCQRVSGDPNEIKELIMSSNEITTIVFNYGSVCAPNRLGNVADLYWSGLGYMFEFGPIIAAEVQGDDGKISILFHIYNKVVYC